MNVEQILKMIRMNFSWLFGFATYVPLIYPAIEKKTRKSLPSRAYYSCWLRHLVKAYENGFSTNPATVAEIGSGGYFGIGIAALLSGANNYFTLEVQEPENPKRNLKIFDDLVILFKNRENIPDDTEFPGIIPHLKSYDFPHHILTDERLAESLKKERLKKIRHFLSSIRNITSSSNNQYVSYISPWTETSLKPKSIDMILSQSVLEHVDNLDYAYRAMHNWLKPNGFLSHAISFDSHLTSKYWNGHWAFSDFKWKLMTGNHKWFMNRQPFSKHVNLLDKYNFEIVDCFIKKRKDGIQMKKLSSTFKKMSNADFVTHSAFFQARKKVRI